MKHYFGKNALFALLVTTLIGTTLGCSDEPPEKLRLQSIAITSPPAKTVYAKDEILDIGGLVVTGTYSDGTIKRETVNLSNVSGYDATTVGQQTVTVTVNGKTATFSVTVNATGVAILQSIAITSQPTKTVYTQGEALNPGGLVVTGAYSDGTTKTEYVYDISGYNVNTVGQQTVTVTVGDKIATFTITVKIIAAFIVNVNLEDPINGIPENIVLSKSGTPASLTLAIVGTYESYEWLLNDDETPVSTSASYTLNAVDCRWVSQLPHGRSRDTQRRVLCKRNNVYR
jgi:hypothetical protein